jgi:hypothetical protein
MNAFSILINLANKLDKLGLYKEAYQIDSILNAIAGMPDYPFGFHWLEPLVHKYGPQDKHKQIKKFLPALGKDVWTSEFIFDFIPDEGSEEDEVGEPPIVGWVKDFMREVEMKVPSYQSLGKMELKKETDHFVGPKWRVYVEIWDVK